MNPNATPMQYPPRLLIVGCGYLGVRVGYQAQSAGWKVLATSRRRLDELRGHGFETLRFDWNDSRDLQAIASRIATEGVDRILVAVSYDRASSVDRYVSQVVGLTRFCSAVKTASRITNRMAPDLCYISTTGVYHQTGGVWVDERSPTRPLRDGGRAHLFAEAKVRSHLADGRWTILRLSGIYGPGRVPRAADVRAARHIASPPSGHLNLIHVEDAAAAVIANFSWLDQQHSRPRERLYVVSDDHPVVRQRFYEEIARQTDSPSPKFVDPAKNSAVQIRSETDKRMWNRRFKRDLMPRLRYSSYVAGLQSILRAGLGK